MPKMSTHEINGSGVEEVPQTRQLEEAVLPEMSCDIPNKRSTARRNAKPSRQDTEAEQQWPIPTKILTKIGKPLKINPSNYEESLF